MGCFDELFAIYQKVDDILFKKVAEINKNESVNHKKIGMPFFMFGLDNYLDADVKLMVFGQEPHHYGDSSKWKSLAYGEDESVTLDDMMNFYEEFMMEKYGGSGIFQRTIRNFVKRAGEKKPGVKVDYLWNNILKIGLLENKGADTFMKQWYPQIIKPYLNPLIPEEINILKPDHIIFFTGYKHDNYINDIFDNPQWIETDSFHKNDLCEVKIPNVKKAFRTYHPLYLNTFHRKEEVYERMLNEIM